MSMPIKGDFVVIEMAGDWHVLFQPEERPNLYLSIARFNTAERANAYREIEVYWTDLRDPRDADAIDAELLAIEPVAYPDAAPTIISRRSNEGEKLDIPPSEPGPTASPQPERPSPRASEAAVVAPEASAAPDAADAGGGEAQSSPDPSPPPPVSHETLQEQRKGNVESQAKAVDEAKVGPLREAPGADEERPVQTANAETGSRGVGDRAPTATDEHGRDSPERRAPLSSEESRERQTSDTPHEARPDSKPEASPQDDKSAPVDPAGTAAPLPVLTSREQDLYDAIRANADAAGCCTIMQSEIGKIAGIPRGSLTYVMTQLCLKNVIRRDGDTIRLRHFPDQSGPEPQEPAPTPVKKSDDSRWPKTSPAGEKAAVAAVTQHMQPTPPPPQRYGGDFPSKTPDPSWKGASMDRTQPAIVAAGDRPGPKLKMAGSILLVDDHPLRFAAIMATVVAVLVAHHNDGKPWVAKGRLVEAIVAANRKKHKEARKLVMMSSWLRDLNTALKPAGCLEVVEHDDDWRLSVDLKAYRKEKAA